MLTVRRGAALYVGALIGPGLLLVPSLAAQQAGPASILAWAALLGLSAALAVTFAALGVRHPVSEGVAAYAREALGERAAAITGAWFLAAVVFGAPAVALIGGFYVSDLTGSGTTVADLVALAMLLSVLGTNAAGLRVSSGVQLALAAILVGVVAIAVLVALPTRGGEHWAPFAPHGWWAVGTAANILIWLFIGWEAMAQLAGEFRDPTRELPRAIALAFGVITVLYAGLAVATIGVGAAHGSRVPLADLIAVGFGRVGRDATAVLAVTLTMGTMNVYIGSAAKLASALAARGALPGWLARGAPRDVPRRPLVILTFTGTLLLAGLAAGLSTPDALIRATSACFLAVYLLALASATRILTGAVRAAAAAAFVAVAVVAVFSAAFLLVPLGAALACSPRAGPVGLAAIGRRARRRAEPLIRATRSRASGSRECRRASRGRIRRW